MTTRQLIVFGAIVVALTLSLAWLVERRQVLSLRQELNRWGGGEPSDLLQHEASEERPDGSEPRVGWPDDEDEL